jgi:hypothetical protein
MPLQAFGSSLSRACFIVGKKTELVPADHLTGKSRSRQSKTRPQTGQFMKSSPLSGVPRAHKGAGRRMRRG